MWQKEKKDSSIVSLAFLLTLATTPMAATLVVPDSTLAKSLERGEQLVLKPSVAKRAIASGISQTVVTAETATNAISSSDSQTFVSPLNKNAIQTLLKWLLLPVSALGGLLLWWLLKRRQSKHREVESTPNMPLEEMSTGTLGASEAPPVSDALGQTAFNLVENFQTSSTLSNGDSAAEVTPSGEVASNVQLQTDEETSYPQLSNIGEAESDSNVQTQTTERRALYPQLPDVWEAESGVELPSTEVTTSREQLDSDKVTSDLQAPTVVFNTSYLEQPGVSVASDVKPRVTVVTISRTEEALLTESNWQENGDTALTAVAPLQSRLTDESDTKATEQTKQVNIYTEETPESSEVASDVPTQATDSSAQALDIAAVASDVQPQVTEVSASSFVEVLNVSEVALDLEAPAAVVTTSYPEFLDSAAVASDVPQVTEDIASFVKLPDVSEVALDMVADAAELTTDQTEEVFQMPTSAEDTTETTKAAGFGVGKWAAVYGIEETSESNLKLETKPVVEEGSVDVESSIVLTPRTPKWAYVFWKVSEAQKEPLRHRSGSQLALRIYDVTNIDLSYQSPLLVQQYECEETTHNRYVAIPVSERDYMTEVGYITEDARWLVLSRSATVRVKSRPEPNFWFVADAELIIHGATEPGSTVAIGGHPIKLKADGTFHLRIPFTDSLIDYLMEAVAANGEQAKSIHMKFFQEAPESNTNT